MSPLHSRNSKHKEQQNHSVLLFPHVWKLSFKLHHQFLICHGPNLPIVHHSSDAVETKCAKGTFSSQLSSWVQFLQDCMVEMMLSETDVSQTVLACFDRLKVLLVRVREWWGLLEDPIDLWQCSLIPTARPNDSNINLLGDFYLNSLKIKTKCSNISNKWKTVQICRCVSVLLCLPGLGP